jgi:hypothetical protein
MSTENDLWNMNWRFVQSINEMTEEIIILKKRENKRKEEHSQLLENMEDLKSKYYVALANLNLEKEKNKSKKKKWRLF